MQLEALETFENLEYGDEIIYIGPDKLPSPHAAPADWKQPYRFRYVSFGGTLCCYTTFNGEKNLRTEHPANDPQNWRRATPEEVDG